MEDQHWSLNQNVLLDFQDHNTRSPSSTIDIDQTTHNMSDSSIIGCLLLNHLLLHIYHCIGFQDVKQAWCQINVSLLKTAFVLLHATRNYFMVSRVIGNMSGICWTHEINFHQRTNLFFPLESGR